MIMEKREKYIVGIGAANFDISGKSRAAVTMRDSNPGHFSMSAGGVTRNILENTSRLGLSSKLISAVGDDAFSERILADSNRAGIDMSAVLQVPGATSSSYISLLDETGDMLVAMSDMSILERLTPDYLDSRKEMIYGAAAVVCDPGLPREMIEHIITLTDRTIPLFTDPVSTAYAKKLRGLTGGFFCIKPNKIELSVMAGMEIDGQKDIENACDKILASGAERVVVTLGADGCFYKDADGLAIQRKLRPLDRMENATGGGDAFSAAVLYGYLKDLPIIETLDLALAAGIAAISSKSTINPDMSVELLREIVGVYREHNAHFNP